MDSTQLEQLRMIGAYLHEVRQEQGRSLEEISAKTYIPLRLLKALEAGQDKILPEPVFVQGFIRRYADVLGLDGMGVSQQFPVHSAVPDPEAESAVGEEAPARTPRTAVLDAPELTSRGTSRRRPQPSYTPYVAIGAIAALMLGGAIWGLSRIGSRSTNAASEADAPEVVTALEEPDTTSAPANPPAASASPSPPAAPASPAVTTASPSPVSPSPRTTASPRPAASPSPSSDAPVTVKVNLTGDSWMQVITDGAVEFEGIMSKGSQETWTAEEEITIVSGNAGAVRVSANNGKAETMGSLGLVEERTFTADAAESSSN